METKVEALEGNRVKVTVTVEGATVADRMKKKYKEPMMTVVSIGGDHHLLSGSGQRLKVTISGYGAGGSSNDGDGFSQEPEE